MLLFLDISIGILHSVKSKSVLKSSSSGTNHPRYIIRFHKVVRPRLMNKFFIIHEVTAAPMSYLRAYLCPERVVLPVIIYFINKPTRVMPSRHFISQYIQEGAY